MDLVRRLAAQSAKKDAETADLPKSKVSIRWLAAWRRMALRALWIGVVAMNAAVVEAWERMAERQLEEAKRRNPELTTKAKPTKSKKAEKATVKPMAKGAPLTRSKQVKARLEPEDCPHAEDRIQARGGRAGEATFHWLTCLDCGSRWTRVDDQGRQMQPAPSTQISGPTCECGKPRVMRTNPLDDSMFWGCSVYPTCTRTKKIKAEDLPDLKAEKDAGATGWEEVPMAEPMEMPAETPESQAVQQLVEEMRRRIFAGKPKAEVIAEIMSQATSSEEALLVAQAAGQVGI